MSRSRVQQLKKLRKKQRAARKTKRRTIVRASLTSATIVAIAIVLLGAFGVIGPNPGTFVESQGNLHIPSIDAPHAPYNSNPPTSGPHVQAIAAWGVHTDPVPLELQVHNLEDGGVIIQYNNIDAEALSALEDIVRSHREQVILAPYPDMDERIAITAWTRMLTLDEVDTRSIRRFIRAYKGLDHHVG